MIGMMKGCPSVVLPPGLGKKYGKQISLGNVAIESHEEFGKKFLHMTIDPTYYALLGPSGCGKTILLSCILGIKPLDSGLIKLGVSSRKEIGYMPQEVALFQEFTTLEVLRFYGTLYGLSKEQLKSRLSELSRILELPNWDNRISSLSGGEQRRVSFGAALLHNPKLLVLDEPTVGVDPMLSFSMWQYLVKLTTEGHTVLITTHYIEEARNAHKIGVMRKGKVLCEGSPEKILQREETTSLEGAFLNIIQKEKKELHTRQCVKQTLKEKPKLTLQTKDILNWNRLRAQILKNIIWMQRNTLIMFFLLLLPAMQSFFYSISFGKQPIKLRFIVMSEEVSTDFMQTCNSERHPYVGDLNCSITPPFTCHYAGILNETFDIEYKYSLREAQADIKNNKAWGMIYIAKNFTDSLIERLHEVLLVSDESLDASQIAVTLDMSNYIIGNFVRQQLTQDMSKFLKEVASSCGLSPMHLSSALKFMDPVFGGKNPLFAHSGLPGFFCSFCFYFTMIFTSGAVMMEKIIGTLERSMAAGMTYFEVVCAHLVVQVVLMTFQKFIMYSIFYFWFDFPMIGDVKLILALLVVIEAVGIAYGFLLTELFSSDRLVSYAGIGGTLAVFSLGGIIWPLEGAHFLVKSWVWAFPISPAVDSYKNIASKGYGFFHPSVYLGFLSCLLWTVILALLSYFLMKKKRSCKS